MNYEKTVKGNFIERPNRFVASVMIQGKRVEVHVKNTGRCKELLVPEALVYLEDFIERMGKRRLRYSLIGVEKNTENGRIMVNMDSQSPNKVIKESLLSGQLRLPDMAELIKVKPEAEYGESRLDFYVQDKEGKEAYVEVKGVTLESDGVAMFPDAPTIRGIKHINDLCNAVEEGKKGFIIFVIQMKGIRLFKPNNKTHKAFGDALRNAASKGVIILAYDCYVGEDFIMLGDEVKTVLRDSVNQNEENR